MRFVPRKTHTPFATSVDQTDARCEKAQVVAPGLHRSGIGGTHRELPNMPSHMIQAVIALSGRRQGLSGLTDEDIGPPDQGTADPAQTETATAFASAL